MNKTDYIKLCKELVLESINTNEYAVFLFGSRAYDSHPEKADIDIGILGEGVFPESERYIIKDKIEESEIPYNVDIIDFSRTSNTFREVALRKIEVWTKPSHIIID
jgi:uncharacterized protein